MTDAQTIWISGSERRGITIPSYTSPGHVTVSDVTSRDDVGDGAIMTVPEACNCWSRRGCLSDRSDSTAAC